MHNGIQLLLTGRSKETLAELETRLRTHSGCAVSMRLITNGHTDPLHGLTALPEILVLVLSAAWQDELQALAERNPSTRPVTLVIGAEGDTAAMRMAMQAGARDFITFPVSDEEFAAALRHVMQDARARRAPTHSRITAFVNARGGAGASFLATNCAHLMTSAGKRVALLDMDLQFGALALGLDLKPKHGMLQALVSARELDGMALEGFMTRHGSGLSLLAVVPDHVVLPGEIPPNALNRVLDLVGEGYEQIVVDLPRMIDPLVSVVLERCDKLVIVVQQDVAQVRDGKRYARIVREELELPDDRIEVVINRYDSKRRVSRKDIEDALRPARVHLIPNDYRKSSEAADLGVPLQEAAPRSAVTRALAESTKHFMGLERKSGGGLLRRALGLFSA